ncbi:aminotransferase class IV family protein [Marinobacter sp. M1N3S26]|uniref:aminotransferase class IV family protein n=1 Tax=unclassified Marinobacter TaxID=83889 RepID=UPI00387AEB1E
MSKTTPFKTMIDGREALMSDLPPLAFSGFAHFTAMQVRNGAVRGLDLHLQRLSSASVEMFGQAHSDDDIRAFLRSAVEGGPTDLSLTATVFSRRGEFTPVGASNDPAILVRTAPAANGPVGPLWLDAVTHERPLPTIKHVGEATKTYYLRKAVEKGFDDAAYLDRHGHVSEATIWNLAFWDGQTVIWPQAELLDGITMQIVKRQLEALNIPQRGEPLTLETVQGLSGGVVMNSWTPGVPVSGIGKVTLPISARFNDLLHQAYQMEPEVRI